MGGLGLVGRDGELRRVHRSLAAASAGTGRFVLIAGEPGIGKSRLASEAVQLARQRGFRSAWGSCRETEEAPPYWPWTQALRAPLDPTLASQPMLTALLNPDASGANLETDRFRLFDHASQALVAAASTQPLLVVFDDLHRADEASITLLRFLVLSVREAAIVLLGTYRDTEAPATHPLSRLVAEVAGSEQFEPIELRIGYRGARAQHRQYLNPG
jgi:predicted ATPase